MTFDHNWKQFFSFPKTKFRITFHDVILLTDVTKVSFKLRATLKRSFYFSFCPPSALPSDQKKLPQTLPLSDRPPSDLRPPKQSPSVRPKKTSPDFPLSDLRRPTWGQSYFGRTVGRRLLGRTIGRRMADGRKFLLRFRTALKLHPRIIFKTLVAQNLNLTVVPNAIFSILSFRL